MKKVSFQLLTQRVCWEWVQVIRMNRTYIFLCVSDFSVVSQSPPHRPCLPISYSEFLYSLLMVIMNLETLTKGQGLLRRTKISVNVLGMINQFARLKFSTVARSKTKVPMQKHEKPPKVPLKNVFCTCKFWEFYSHEN